MEQRKYMSLLEFSSPVVFITVKKFVFSLRTLQIWEKIWREDSQKRSQETVKEHQINPPLNSSEFLDPQKDIRVFQKFSRPVRTAIFQCNLPFKPDSSARAAEFWKYLYIIENKWTYCTRLRWLCPRCRWPDHHRKTCRTFGSFLDCRSLFHTPCTVMLRFPRTLHRRLIKTKLRKL